jgi:hypothetical protein
MSEVRRSDRLGIMHLERGFGTCAEEEHLTYRYELRAAYKGVVEPDVLLKPETSRQYSVQSH